MPEHSDKRGEVVFPAELRIEAMMAGGDSLGHIEGMAVFVPGGAPGDLVEAAAVKRTRDYVIAKPTKIIEPSPLRREPPCPYFQYCGGCQWQHLKYDAQLDSKEWILKDSLERIGRMTGAEMEPIVPSPEEFHYRHRVQLKVLTSGGKMRWGFFASTTHDLIDVRNCLIAHPAINALIGELGSFIPSMGINPSRLGCVEINVDGTGRRVHCILHPRRRRFEIPGHGRRITYRTTEGKELEVSLFNSTMIRKLPVRAGEFTFQAGDFQLYTGAGVFSQTNLSLNPRLVEKVLEFADPKPDDTVADIYCGVGNYSIPLAMKAGNVEAVENNRRACLYGNVNAASTGLSNIRFIQENAHVALKALPGRTAVIVINPPRVGAADIMDDIASMSPRKVVYVSCNPATLSRDLFTLSTAGYRLAGLAPFDMFPQTHHLETVALMTRDNC